MFQVFQLRALVLRGPATIGERLANVLGRVAIPDRKMLLYVQSFVRCPHFTQRSFFLESGLTLLFESAAIADSNTLSSVYAPWINVETACAGQVVSDLRACWDRIVLRRSTAKDTSGHWYQGCTTRSEISSTLCLYECDFPML